MRWWPVIAVASSALLALATSASAQTRATRTTDFLESIGMNIHFWGDGPGGPQGVSNYGDYYANNDSRFSGKGQNINGQNINVSALAYGLNYMHIHHIRSSTDSQDATNRFIGLSQLVPNLHMVNQTSGNFDSWSGYFNRSDGLKNQLDGFEGANEIGNTSNFNYTNLAGQPASSYTAACNFQQDLQSQAVAWRSRNGVNVPVVQASVGGDHGLIPYLTAVPCKTFADYSNGHMYFGAGMPVQVKNYNLYGEPNVINEGPDATKIFATETGSVTNIYNNNGMDEPTAAKQFLKGYLAFYVAETGGPGGPSMAHTYVYELSDTFANTPTPNVTDVNSSEDHYGQFRFDWSPKPSADAVAFQWNVLNDTGAAAATFTTDTLTYSLSNAPPNTFSLLMEKNDGTFVLAMWAEPPPPNNNTCLSGVWMAAFKKDCQGNVYNSGNTGYAINTAATNVTVNLPAMKNMVVADPFGAASTALPDGSTATIPISDHPVYLTMALASAVVVPPPPPPTSPGTGSVCTFSGTQP